MPWALVIFGEMGPPLLFDGSPIGGGAILWHGLLTPEDLSVKSLSCTSPRSGRKVKRSCLVQRSSSRGRK
eukprot:581161-Amphidinium_carterae.1